jgi:transcriptional regulator with XRE-family HTH domain
MHSPIGKTHRQYVAEQREQDPEFAAAYDEARIETDLALALAEVRELRNMSQRDLADTTGIKQPMINRLERAAQSPTVPTLFKLVRALGATVQIDPSGVTVRPAALLEGWAKGVHRTYEHELASQYQARAAYAHWQAPTVWPWFPDSGASVDRREPEAREWLGSASGQIQRPYVLLNAFFLQAPAGSENIVHVGGARPGWGGVYGDQPPLRKTPPTAQTVDAVPSLRVTS